MANNSSNDLGLDTLLMAQKEFMKIIEVDKQAARDGIREAALGAIEESVEIVREFRKNVPWRNPTFEVNDGARAFEESVDVLFYLLEIWVFMGKSGDDVVQAYFQKRSRNILRIEEKRKTIINNTD